MIEIIEFLKSWTKDLVTLIIVISFLEMILPSGNIRKFVKMTIGLIVILVIINPFIKLVQSDIDIEKEIMENIDNQYKDRGNSYSEFESTQNSQVKEIYLKEIRKKVEASVLENTSYEVSSTQIEMEENKEKENYGEIKRMNILLKDKGDNSEIGTKNENKIETIKIDVNIGDKIKETEIIKEDLKTKASKELEDIKKKISEKFEISKEKIFIDLKTKE